LTVKDDLTAGDGVVGMPHEGVGQGGFPGAVGPHDGMNLTLWDGEGESFDDFLVVNTDVQVANNQVCHTQTTP